MARWTRRLLKNASVPIKSAPARSWARVANAASISSAVLAFRIWICRPRARPAASASFAVDKARLGLVGVNQHGDHLGVRYQLMQQFKYLRRYRAAEIAY